MISVRGRPELIRTMRQRLSHVFGRMVSCWTILTRLSYESENNIDHKVSITKAWIAVHTPINEARAKLRLERRESWQ